MKRGAIVIVFLLAGCTTGAGTKWWAPATWFSHAPANAVDIAQRKETEAQHDAIKLAQKAAHETQVALTAAPVSRPVTVAADSAQVTAGLLDQASGPLTASELAEVHHTVSGLLSEDPKVRAEAERQRQVENTTVADISTRLATAQAATNAAEHNLRTAFERENALANELRSAHALHWILGGVALLCLIGWVYVRFFLGGIPGAIGSALSKLETKNPAAADEFRDILDRATNRHEQNTIRSAYLQAR